MCTQYYDGLLEEAETRREAAVSLAVEKAMSLKVQRIQQDMKAVSLKLQRTQQDMKKLQEENEFLQQVFEVTWMHQ